jgi:hypothetical protein
VMSLYDSLDSRFGPNSSSLCPGSLLSASYLTGTHGWILSSFGAFSLQTASVSDCPAIAHPSSMFTSAIAF